MRLTDIEIKRLASPKRDNRTTFDDAVKGFGIRITPTGARTFILAYRRKSDGKQRRYSIGAFGAWTTPQARRRWRGRSGGRARGQPRGPEHGRSLSALRAGLYPAQSPHDAARLQA